MSSEGYAITGYAVDQPYGDGSKPGRIDINGEEWWACDPYPTWFRWDDGPDGPGTVLRTDHARFADLPDPKGAHALPPEECWGEDVHRDNCDGIVRTRWSGVACACGALWYCL